MPLLWLALGLVALVLLRKGVTTLQLTALRRAGLYPAAGQARMADVKRLVQARKSIWAIRCYREIHPQASLKDARQAVDDFAAAD